MDTDSAWFSAYGVRDVPTIVVLNTDHKIEVTITENVDALEPVISKLVVE